jgi:hypothetical protein
MMHVREFLWREGPQHLGVRQGGLYPLDHAGQTFDPIARDMFTNRVRNAPTVSAGIPFAWLHCWSRQQAFCPLAAFPENE